MRSRTASSLQYLISQTQSLYGPVMSSSISDEQTASVWLSVQALVRACTLAPSSSEARVWASSCPSCSRPPVVLFSTGAGHPEGADGAELGASFFGGRLVGELRSWHERQAQELGPPMVSQLPFLVIAPGERGCAQQKPQAEFCPCNGGCP